MNYNSLDLSVFFPVVKDRKFVNTTIITQFYDKVKNEKILKSDLVGSYNL